MDVIQFITAAGIGGIIVALLQGWIASRTAMSNRSFQERKEAYIGFLEAMHQAEIKRTREASMIAGYWQNRCALVAPEKVRLCIREVEATNPIDGMPHPQRDGAMERLREAMRRDLGISV